MARKILTQKEFLFLHTSLMEKYIGENGGVEPPNVRQRYGFALGESQEEDETLPTLKKSIENDPEVTAFLKKTKVKIPIETRYSLYHNYIAVNRDKDALTHVKIADGLLNVFLKYLGYDSLKAFQSDLAKKQPPVEYAVFFYSRDFKTEDFDLFIDYGSRPYYAEMKGFHIDTKSLPFKGHAIKKGLNLYLNFENASRGGEEFHIIAKTGTITDPQDMNIMVGAFMGISTHTTPTCGECLIVKKSNDNVYYQEEGIRRIRAFMMLKRNRFTVKNSEIRSLNDITALGISVTDIFPIGGTYQVYGFDQTGTCYLSKLTINPETFETYYETVIFNNNHNLKKLRCELSISNIISKKLCLTTKSSDNKGREIVSFVMTEYGEFGEEGRVCDAVFITMSRHTGKSVAGHIIVVKTSEPFEPKKLSKEEVQMLKEKYSALEKLSKRH